MTKRSEWKYKKIETKHQIRGKLSPKLMLVDKTTGTAWLYNSAALNDRLDKNPNLSECHTKWLGAWHRQGYALVNVHRMGDDNAKSGVMNVQRLLKAIQLDRPLLASERVYATCHNIACTNLLHLKIGTRSECSLNGVKPPELIKSRFPTEWLLKNRTLIESETAAKLAKQLDIKAPQASYLKRQLKKLVSANGYEVIDLRKRKSAAVSTSE